MDNISKPIIETKDKVNDPNNPFACYDEVPEPEHDPSEFYVETPISINGNAFSGTYKVGQKLPIYENQQYEVEEVIFDGSGNPFLDERGKPRTKIVRKIRSVQLVIDEEFKQNLLSRSANAKAQDERVFKNEGIRIDFDEKTGNTIITRKM